MRALFLLLAGSAACSGADFFAGAMGGVATLSADAQTQGTPPNQFSAYKPQNGAVFQVFGGSHFTDYFSAQLSYGWNRNAVTLSGADVARQASYEAPMRATMHSLVAEGMVYFRPRASRIRPYLAAGPGLSILRAASNGPVALSGPIAAPDARIESTRPALRVAVGIDVRLSSGLRFRYSFSETLQRNALSRALRPPAERNLANFQNLWGINWEF